MGNSLADRAASLTIQACNLQDAYDLHDLTHINWRGLHKRFPQIPIRELKKLYILVNPVFLIYKYRLYSPQE